MNKTFNYYIDGGHGWVAVKRKLLKQLGVLKQVTEFSFQKGETVYLEEDHDTRIFWEAFEKEFNCKPLLIEKISRGISHVRRYQRFSIDGIKTTSPCGTCGQILPKFSDWRTFFCNQLCLDAYQAKL